MRRVHEGFTLIELMVVMATLGVLLALAVPRYIDQVDRSRETVLRNNLAAIREGIDQFRADKDRYPAALQELVSERYLRVVPTDPMTERSDSWVVLPPPGQPAGQVFDVRSGAPGSARDGTPYAKW